MAFIRGMDTKNVIHLHNGVLLDYQNQLSQEMHRQMEWSRKYTDWGYPITELYEITHGMKSPKVDIGTKAQIT